MRATINVEFTDDELRKFAEDVARRVGLNFIHDVMGHLRGAKINPDIVAMAAQAFAAAVSNSFAKKETPSDPADPKVYPPRIVCERIAADAHIEEGWACCSCSVYNEVHRHTCRNCGHVRCDPIVTPPPAPNEPPSGVGSV
jgi:hypothetical protein